MREVTYTDFDGRKWRRLLPEGVPDEEASSGVPAGPPPLMSLNLPLDLEVRLHNELFHRGLLTAADINGKRVEVRSALMAALRLDVEAISAVYHAGALTPIGPVA